MIRDWFLGVTFVLSLSFAPVSAQGPSSPPPVPGVPATAPQKATDLIKTLEKLNRRTVETLRAFRVEVERKLVYFLVVVGFSASTVIGLVSFLRTLRQHDGGSADLLWIGLRFTLCLMLIPGSVYLVGWAAGVGYSLSQGDLNGTPHLGNLVDEQRKTFDENFHRFQVLSYLVKVDGQTIWLNPDPSADASVYLAALEAKELSAKDLIDGPLDPENWSLPHALNGLQFSRAILELGDFVLVVLGAVLVCVFRLVGPLAACVAIDRGFAERLSKPAAWGCAVCTMLLPLVSQIIRLFAYTLANLVLYSVMPDKPVHVFVESAMILKSDGSDVVMSSYILAGGMLVAALCLPIAPYLAFRFSKGEFFEATSNAVSGWITGFASTGVGILSGTMAANLNRAAEQSRLEGAANSASVENRAARKAEGQMARASWMLQNTQTQSAATQARAGIQGGLATTLGGIEGSRAGGLAGVAAQVNRDNYLAPLAAWSGNASNHNQMMRNLEGMDASRRSGNMGLVVNGVGAVGSELGGNYLEKRSQALGNPKSSVNSAGSAALGVLAVMGKSPNDLQFQLGGRAEIKYYEKQKETNETNSARVVSAHNQYAEEAMAGINYQADVAAGAAKSGAGIATGGVNQAESMMLGENKRYYEANQGAITMRADAKDQSIAVQRAAAEKAAEQARLAALYNIVGSQVARGIEQTHQGFRY